MTKERLEEIEETVKGLRKALITEGTASIVTRNLLNIATELIAGAVEQQKDIKEMAVCGMTFVKAFLSSLPSKRDWLDPDMEKAAKRYVADMEKIADQAP